jgi:hypothetical protein
LYTAALTKGEEESPLHHYGHGESIITCALSLVRGGEYPKGNMTVCYFLFPKEQIKGIIINGAAKNR